MYCENCGQEIPAGSGVQFCPACGGKLWAAGVADETMKTDGTPSGRGSAPQPPVGYAPPVNNTPWPDMNGGQPAYDVPVPETVPAAAGGAKKKSSGSKNMPVIIAACVAVALVVSMILIFPRMLKKEDGDPTAAQEPETTAAGVTPDETAAEPGSSEATTAVITAATQPTTAAPATSADEPQTNDVVVFTDATTAPPTTTVYLYSGQTYVVASTTPAHAGVVLRSGPGSSYEKLTTVREGVVVLYTGQQNSGYVSVEYYLNGKHYTGWLVYRYLASNTTGKDHYNGSAPSTTAATTTARQLPVARISNRTDEHLGLVLRSGPSASSSHLGILPEGTLLYLLGESSGGYTKVETVDDGRTGWVMEAYLDK